MSACAGNDPEKGVRCKRESSNMKKLLMMAAVVLMGVVSAQAESYTFVWNVDFYDLGSEYVRAAAGIDGRNEFLFGGEGFPTDLTMMLIETLPGGGYTSLKEISMYSWYQEQIGLSADCVSYSLNAQVDGKGKGEGYYSGNIHMNYGTDDSQFYANHLENGGDTGLSTVLYSKSKNLYQVSPIKATGEVSGYNMTSEFFFAPTHVTPEPTSGLLVLLGMALMGLKRRHA